KLDDAVSVGPEQLRRFCVVHPHVEILIGNWLPVFAIDQPNCDRDVLSDERHLRDANENEQSSNLDGSVHGLSLKPGVFRTSCSGRVVATRTLRRSTTTSASITIVNFPPLHQSNFISIQTNYTPTTLAD